MSNSPRLFAFVALLLLPCGDLAAQQVESFAGELTVNHGHQLEDGASRYFYLLHPEADPQAAPLRFYRQGERGAELLGRVFGDAAAIPATPLVSGLQVVIQGNLEDGDIVLAPGAAGDVWIAPTAATSGGISAAAIGDEHDTIVILGNFQNLALSCPDTEVEGIVFDNADSTAAAYLESSFGAMTFNGDVVGPYTIPFQSTESFYWQWPQPLQDAATAAGVDLSGYEHQVYVLPPNGTGYSGLGSIGIGGFGYSQSWIFDCDGDDTYAHELGHNLTLRHASRYFDVSQTVSEYGDTTDVMGSVATVRHHNGPHKAMLGWSDVKNVYFDGIHTIRRLEDTGASPHVLRIPNPDPNVAPSTEYYWVSYRVGVLLDANLSATHKSKLFVHEAAVVPNQTYLRDWLDTEETFDELPSSTSPVEIKLVSQDNVHATVEVTTGLGPPPCQGPDADLDEVGDACDNCTLVLNPLQTDSNSNGFGDACDCDFDESGFCNATDFSEGFLPDFLSGTDSGIGTDMDGSGTVNGTDFNVYFLPGYFSGQSGPSAFVP